MNARLIRILPAVIVLATSAKAASYTVRHLDPTDALMALNVRVPSLGQECRITPIQAKDPASAGVRGYLEVTCSTEAIQSKIQAALDVIDAPPPTLRFHVAVMTASRKDGPMPDVSAGEAKALNDFKKVMTYKSFQVEAETVLQSNFDAQGQLNGNYQLQLSVNPNTAGGDSIDVRSFLLRGTELQTTPSSPQTFYTTYIQTSFSIKRGETVVLGTSVSDQQARVVLVTALP
jgi:hypothetical protein